MIRALVAIGVGCGIPLLGLGIGFGIGCAVAPPGGYVMPEGTLTVIYWAGGGCFAGIITAAVVAKVVAGWINRE